MKYSYCNCIGETTYMMIYISFSSYNQPIRIPNIYNEIFVYLFFEYFDKLKVLNSDQNTPKKANWTVWLYLYQRYKNTLHLNTEKVSKQKFVGKIRDSYRLLVWVKRNSMHGTSLFSLLKIPHFVKF